MARTSPPPPLDPLDQVRMHPLEVTTLELHGLGLSAFPSEVLACTNLESLTLRGAVRWDGDQRIPDEIRRLTQLVTLDLDAIGPALPESLGALVRLETLTLTGSHRLEALPDSLGSLPRLKHLYANDCQALRRLPASLGRARSLESLVLRSTPVTDVPASLVELAELRVLHLPDGVAALPAGFGRLALLEDLQVSAAALASIAHELPALSKLRRLEILGTATTLPDQVGSLSELRYLGAYQLGLESLPPSLARLSRLEELEVSENQLTSLLELVEQLPALRTLGYDRKRLSAESRRIQARLKSRA